MDELILAIQEAANTIASPTWADIMGVFLSFVAIVVAFIVAFMQYKILKRQTNILDKQTSIVDKQTSIADRQNQIALFEKRLEIFDILLACSVSIRQVKPTNKYEDILKNIVSLLAEDPWPYQKFDRVEAAIYLSNCSMKLRRSTFLFPDKIVPYLLRISKALILLASADAKTDGLEKYNEKIQRYFETIEDFEKKEILKDIQEEMKII